MWALDYCVDYYVERGGGSVFVNFIKIFIKMRRVF
jgi:hypothetical protein